MTAECPHCGSRHLRSSASYSAWEHVARFFGFLKLRCRDCDERFTFAVWDLRNSIYAKCPRCYRLDLSRWQPSHYRVPQLDRFLMHLGARAHRCDACRCNFVSFRPAKLADSRKKKPS